MNLNRIVSKIQGLFFKTSSEWKAIKEENVTIQQLFIPYAMLLAAIPAISSFFGLLIWSGRLRAFFAGRALFLLIYTYLIILALMFLLGLAINELAPNFGCKKDKTLAFKLSVYMLTPFCIASILLILPFYFYWFVLLLSLYGVYLLYLGLGILLDCPADKKLGFAAVVGLIYFVAINLFYLAFRPGYF